MYKVSPDILQKIHFFFKISFDNQRILAELPFVKSGTKEYKAILGAINRCHLVIDANKLIAIKYTFSVDKNCMLHDNDYIVLSSDNISDFCKYYASEIKEYATKYFCDKEVMYYIQVSSFFVNTLLKDIVKDSLNA